MSELRHIKGVTTQMIRVHSLLDPLRQRREVAVPLCNVVEVVALALGLPRSVVQGLLERERGLIVPGMPRGSSYTIERTRDGLVICIFSRRETPGLPNIQ